MCRWFQPHFYSGFNTDHFPVNLIFLLDSNIAQEENNNLHRRNATKTVLNTISEHLKLLLCSIIFIKTQYYITAFCYFSLEMTIGNDIHL